MGTSRFVRPETAILTISNGDTLTVRRRLTAGEQRTAYARMYIAGVDGQLRSNPLQSGIELIAAYLLDWSLTDDAGEHVPIRGLSADELTSVLDGLEPESLAEIRIAIEQHEERTKAAREQEKKLQAGASASSATSASPSVLVGASSGSGR